MEQKPFWLSKTIWFNVLTAIIIIASLFGYNSTEATSSGWAQSLATALVAVSPVINIALRFWTEKGIKIR